MIQLWLQKTPPLISNSQQHNDLKVERNKSHPVYNWLNQQRNIMKINQRQKFHDYVQFSEIHHLKRL